MFKLGVYWFFEAPKNLYQFDYFTFHKGRGGFAYNPTDLAVSFESQYVDDILKQINELSTHFPYHSGLFIYYDHNRVMIEISSYHFFDYDFLFALKIEEILSSKNIRLIKQFERNNKSVQKYNAHFLYLKTYSDKIEVVGSPIRKYGAETLSLRIDCNIKTKQKERFIDTLKYIIKEHNIDIFYYYEKAISERTNLILFLTNGRQGYQLAQPQFIDIKSLAAEIEHLFVRFDLVSGLLGGMDYYPVSSKNKIPNIQLMIDDEIVKSLIG